MLTRLALLPINRMLEQQAWASTQLKPHAGKGAEFGIGDTTLRVRVTDAGLLEPLADELAPAVRITLPAQALVQQLPPDTEALVRQAQISGDAGFAETLSQLLRHLRPDLGAALTPVIGPALAHRVERISGQLAHGMQDAVQRASANLREYVGEGTAPAVSQATFSQFRNDVQQLSAQLDQLETRAARLAN